MIPSIICPATCELCGNWLPQHNSSCPRNGVHPSQWKLFSDNKNPEHKEPVSFHIPYAVTHLEHIYQEQESNVFEELQIL
ncbi:MAG: hypothetical protein EXX96DRAFT_549359 [Benjaminiella poitrasii]|nr:MAG: hypothetical protein EXX96DRAFT_549359 [Benjaminiella poitrasii]